MANMVMLGTQDCLLHPHFYNQAQAFRSHRNVKTCPNFMRYRRRKRSPTGFESEGRCRNGNKIEDQVVPMAASFPVKKNLVVGQVRILKRGEELKHWSENAALRGLGFEGGDDDLLLCSTNWLGPDPETVQKQIRVSDLKVVNGLYAGSAAFVSSPPPSSLPFPAFFKKENNDAATNHIRRLLRLDPI